MHGVKGGDVQMHHAWHWMHRHQATWHAMNCDSSFWLQVNSELAHGEGKSRYLEGCLSEPSAQASCLPTASSLLLLHSQEAC